MSNKMTREGLAAALFAQLKNYPRVALAHLPTPLQPLPRLSQLLGGPQIWCKRDDCTGLATGGNKTRKLEYLLGAARQQGADTVITFGAVQSNHARQTAAACAQIGLNCELLLSRRVRYGARDYERGGNVLFDHLFGARVHIVDVDEVAATLQKLKTELANQGRKVYVIPAGGSNSTGALGYVHCIAELLPQLPMGTAAIVHASSSGGTQAGLAVGVAAANTDLRVIGINTYEPDFAAHRQRIETLSIELARNFSPLTHNEASGHFTDHATTQSTNRSGLSAHRSSLQPKIELHNNYLGEDYGLPTPAMIEAVRLLAKTEGILVDPVYSGKAFAGLLGLIAAGTFKHTDAVVFLHTGGVASLPVYQDDFYKA